MTTLPDYLKNKRQVAQETRMGLGSAAVPAVSIKGGSFTLVDSNGEQRPITTNYLDCIIIDANPKGVQRVFWGLDAGKQPKQFDDSGLPPVCFSDNGIGASQAATEPQSASCASCPMKQFNWPSKIDPTKRTSACRPIKKMAVLAYINGQATPENSVSIYHGQFATEFPFLLRVPVTSHDNLKIYSSQFKDFDVSEVVTRISFVHGAVGQIDFSALGYIDPEANDLVNDVLEAKATDNLVGKNDQPIQEQLPRPQEQQAITKEPRPLPVEASPAPAAKAGRGRPRKQPPIEQSPFAAPQQTSAPFAQHAQGPAQSSEPVQGVAQQIAPFAQPKHGIVQNAPEPSADMEKTLDNIFKLK